MHVSEPRRAFSRVASAVLASAAIAVLSVPAVESTSSTGPARPAARMAPADLYRGQQWTLDALHITRAWKYSRGTGVTVAVLDTGVDGHQADLSGQVIDGPDFTGQARTPGGRYWGRHGTEMASLIAGHGHGVGGSAGVMGVAPAAKILSIRVTWELNDPVRTDPSQVEHARDAVANGIRYAADHGAQVISMSLGGGNLFYNGNTSEQAAIRYALGKGAVLVASSGNDGNAANRRNYPAAYPGVIAVGAVDRAFRPARFTNRHTYISVAAPGVNIVSADATGHGYILGTGTSSSAAFVAGMSALVKARYPRLTPEEVKQALEEGATHRPPDGRSNKIGAGVVDAYGALRTAARINKAEHGDASVETQQPATASRAGDKSRSGPDLVLIAVLSGGGTLIVSSLILGRRQRRRRAREDDEMDDEIPAPASAAAEMAPWPETGARRAARARPSPSTSRSTGLSPWERRPSDAPAQDLPQWGAGPSEAAPPPTEPWEFRPYESPAAETWERPSAEPPPPSSTWFDREPRTDSWERSGSDTPLSSWDRPAAEQPPPADTWDRPVADGSGSVLGPTESYEPPEPEERREYDHAYHQPPESYDALGPYEPPKSTQPNGNGSNGHHPLDQPSASRDFRVADGAEPDPLTDGMVDSSADVGTPLADQSWESIRRGFDRLKDASNWESLAKGDFDAGDESPAHDAFGETAKFPIVDSDGGEDKKDNEGNGNL